MKTDLEWKHVITEAKNGNENAMMDIINDFRPLIGSFSRSGMFKRIEKDDLEAICYLEIIEAVHGFSGEEYASFPGLLAKRLKSRLIKEYHKTVPGYEVVDIDDAAVADSIVDNTASAAFARVELDDLLSLLPPRQRQAIELHYLEGYKMREVAEIMGISLPRVNTLIRKGLKTLRKNF